MGRMIKQFGHIFKLSAEFRDHGIIDTQENRLGFEKIGNQIQGQHCSDIHEPGVIHPGIGTGIIKGIQGFLCDAGQKVSE